jgi:hypothetical protein
MLADIAIGIISNVVYGGLSKVFGMTAVSAQRKVAIERTLSNPKDEKSKKFRRAMDDLEKVLAHRFGAHTQTMDNFLAELNRSAFPEVLTEAILTASDDAGARHLFDSILRNYPFKPSEIDLTNSLFDGINTAVRAQYDLLSQDAEILSLIGNRTKSIQTKLDALNKTIQELASHTRDRTITKQKIDHFRGKLCKLLENQYRYLTVETTRGARKFSITKLYIEPHFVRHDHEELALPKPRRRHSEGEQPDDLFSVGFSEFRNCFRRTVVLGDPGGGNRPPCRTSASNSLAHSH